MRSSNIWIINQYASTPETGIGSRHFYLAHELAKQGHKVYLVAAGFTHILRTLPKVDHSYVVQPIGDFNFVWVKTPHYGNAHSKKRIFNWAWFAWKLRGLVNVIPDKPDAILCSSPSLISFLGAKHLARRFKARLVFEVRDIWPLSLAVLGGYSSMHPVIWLLQRIEDKAYRDSVKVVSNLRNAVEHMTMRGLDKNKFVWIPNGFSMDEINQKQELPEAVLSQLPKDKFIVGYTGTFGVANSLETLIDAAEILKDQLEIAFVLVGNGREYARLKALVSDKGLRNVSFVEPIPKIQVQSMLAEFDVCYIGWKDEHLYRYGIAANKIPEYFFAGKPVVHAYSGCCDPVSAAKAGITVAAGDSGAVADAVLRLYRLPRVEREAMGLNGHRYALDNHEYGALAQKLADVLVGGQ